MRTTATLLLLSAIGCGGAGESSREPMEAAAPVPADTGTPEAGPAVTEAPAAPATTVARAELRMLSADKPLGTLTFERKDKVVSINGEFSGLKKGQNALYIHDKGDCSDKARKIGGHLNPTGSKHGPPASPMRHAGDFGDLTFDKDGNASFAMETDSVTLEPGGADSVVGRAVVVYSRKDNKQGKAGSPIACGVVVLEGQSPETRSSYAVPAAPSPAAATKP
jgi:Cu/Zn superoxide dismutase